MSDCLCGHPKYRHHSGEIQDGEAVLDSCHVPGCDCKEYRANQELKFVIREGPPQKTVTVDMALLVKLEAAGFGELADVLAAMTRQEPYRIRLKDPSLDTRERWTDE